MPVPHTSEPNSLASTAFWLILYFAFNLSLTLYNKAVMQFYSFPFPWTLTTIHTLFGTLGCYATATFGWFKPATLGKQEKKVMLAFSVLYTINIAISNVSLNLVTIPFHQVIRSTVPLFTMFLSILFLHQSYSSQIYLSMIPTIFGVALATYGDYTFTAIGFLLTFFGTILAAVKTVVTNRVQVGRLKLHPLDLLLRMSPLACIQTLMYSYVTGEMTRVGEFVKGGGMTNAMIVALCFNGILAFGLNVVSFDANRRTSALTMGVAGNVKQVLSIILSVTIFQLQITTTNALGILITLLGGAWYTYTDYKEKQSSYQPVVKDVEKLEEEQVELGIRRSAELSR